MKDGERPIKVNGNQDPQYQSVRDGRGLKVRGLWRKGKSFYAQLRVYDPGKGKRVPKRFKLDATNLTEAKKEIEKKRVERDENRVVARRSPTLADYLISYLEVSKSGLQPQTIRGRASMGKHLTRLLGDSRLSDLHPAHISRYQEKRLRDAQPSTINIELGLLKQCLTKAVVEGYLKENPCARVDRIKEEKIEKRLLTYAEILDVAETFKSNLPAAGQQYHDAVLLMAFSGIRVGECVRLRWDTAADWENEELRVGVDFRTKSGKRRSIDFNPQLKTHLQAMWKRRAPDSVFLFPSPQRSKIRDAHIAGMSEVLQRLRGKIPEKFTFHLLRHYYISTLIMNGADLLTVQKWSGHEDLQQIDKTYGHLAPGHSKKVAQSMTFGVKVVKDGKAA